MTVAFLAVLIGIKTLPLSYVMMSLCLTSAIINSLNNLRHVSWRDSTTFVGFILGTITFACAFGVIAVLLAPEGSLKERIRDFSDPILSMITPWEIDNEVSGILIGVCSTIFAGICYGTSIQLQKQIPEDKKNQTTYSVLAISFAIALIIMVLIGIPDNVSEHL